jgi:hypothetical protein
MNKNWNPVGNPRIGKQSGSTTAGDRGPAAGREKPEEFESLTAKLTKAPKSDLDQKRKTT